MIVQMVRFKSGLSESQIMEVMEARAPRYRALPGLLQKYYLRDKETGEYGGLYLWESEEAIQQFRESELAQGIAEVYRVEGQPLSSLLEVLAVLRPGE